MSIPIQSYDSDEIFTRLAKECESLRSALAAERAAGEAAAVRIRELKAKLGHSDTDWAWDSDDVA